MMRRRPSTIPLIAMITCLTIVMFFIYSPAAIIDSYQGLMTVCDLGNISK